jgi:hypothetical protein
VVAALERFLAELAPEPTAQQESRWQRAALNDGVNREPRRTRWGAHAVGDLPPTSRSG